MSRAELFERFFISIENNGLNSLFERYFGSHGSNEDPIFNSRERNVAELVYHIACDEISDTGCNAQWQLAVQKFKRIVYLFKKLKEAKEEFLKSCGHWSLFRELTIERLKKISEDIETNKDLSNIATIVGGLLGTAGGVAVGLSFLTPLAAVTLPLAIGGGVASAVGGTVIAGTAGTEIILLKKNLEEAKDLIIKDKTKFSSMTPWFLVSEKLKKEIESLVKYSLLREMSLDLEEFYHVNMMDLGKGDVLDRFKQAVKLCIVEMREFSNIIKIFGGTIAPAVMTFVIVVCLLRHDNRILVDCAMQVDRLVFDMISRDIQAGPLTVGLASGIAFDVVNLVLSLITIHTLPVSNHARKIKKVAEQLEEEFNCLKSIYKEFKNK